MYLVLLDLKTEYFFMELQLWQTTLRTAPVMVPPLMNLFPHLVSVMELNFEHLQVRLCTFMVYLIFVRFIPNSFVLSLSRIPDYFRDNYLYFYARVYVVIPYARLGRSSQVFDEFKFREGVCDSRQL